MKVKTDRNALTAILGKMNRYPFSFFHPLLNLLSIPLQLTFKTVTTRVYRKIKQEGELSVKNSCKPQIHYCKFIIVIPLPMVLQILTKQLFDLSSLFIHDSEFLTSYILQHVETRHISNVET